MLIGLSTPGTAGPTTRTCLVAGCGCRDARVLSRRHAAFIAARARASGQTSDRIIAAEDTWRLPPMVRES